jgi:RHS repeat-associated protein
VASPEGDRVDVPANALPEPTAISLARRAQADLPKAVPAGTAFLGLLDLDLSGRELAAPALLTLELGEAPAAGQSGLLFQVVELSGAPFYRPVAALAATATGWTTAAIDPADLPWPGVRDSGLYLFARLTAGVGYLRGTVYDVDGAPLARALVSSPAVPWIQLASGGSQAGRYVLPAAPGSFTATAENRATANTGSAAATIATSGARVDLDLLIRVTGPRVIEVVPANGAANVLPGVEPTVRFSEPVDPATIASGVLLYDGATLVPTRLDVQGALVRVRPQATLRPAAVYELRINTAARDLQGHRLEDAVTSTFTTQASQVNSQLDLSRVHLIEPVNGNARVLGRPGAVPAGTVLVVEKTTGTAVTVTGTAGSDGSFELQIAATLADTILLHVVLQGQNEIIVELTPFLTADGHGAHVAADKAATFSTLDGITVKIAAGTFREPTVVHLGPVAKETVTVPHPADLPVVAAFQLDFAGVEAQKPLQISMPTPAGVTHDDLLLSRVYNILGQDYWMLYDLMRRSNGRITTELLPDETAAGAGAPQAVARVAALQPAVPQGAPRQIHAASRRGDGKEYLPGAANPGLYIVMEDTTFLDFVAFPFVPGMFAYFLQMGVDGCIAGINRGVERLLAHDAVLMPTRRGERYTIVGRDLGTGFKLFERTFDPPAAGTITELPPDDFGDRVPPVPVTGSPLRFLLMAPSDDGTEELDRGIKADFQRGSQASQGTLTITGDAGAVQADVQIRLLGLDDTKDRDVHAGGNGAFTLTESIVPGNRYLLAIGAKIGVADHLDIAFSEALPDGFAGIEVLDHSGRSVAPKLDPVGTRETVRITPQPAWRAGETYTLRLKPTLADPAGNRWNRQLDLAFEVEKSAVLDTFNLASVRDIARLGSLLFVAADTQGLVVMDASDPAHLKNLIPGNITFPFPLGDAVSGVTVDPHGRVLVVGGGLTGPGQLKILDPLALDPAAIAASPNDPHVRYAAFKGNTIISDKLGADPGTSLPEGRPRRVAVLSDDQTDRWRIGVDAPPAGVTVAPPQPPNESGDDYTVTVSGSNATAKLPVSFKDLTRGRFNRVDADLGGHYQLTLSVRAGDRVELLRNKASYAYVATQGAGVEVVNVDAFYNETPEDPNVPSPESDVLGAYNGFQDPSLALCGQPVSDIGAALIDLGTLFDRATPHPMTVVGLVGLRGLALLESEPANVGHISFFNELCLNLNGSAQVSGMQVVESYPFDTDGDGTLEESEERDYIVVAHRANGLLILDAADRDNLTLVGWVKLPAGGQAAHVSVDRDRRRIYLSGYGGGIYVIDFDKLPTTQAVDKNQDGTDDRVLETITLPGNTNAAVFLLPELGLAYAGGLGRGLTSVAVGTPRLTAVTEDRGEAGTADGDDPGRPRWRTIHGLAPLGVPTTAPVPGGPDLAASFRVLASLPGVAGDTVKLDVVGLGPGGLPVAGAGPDTVADLPAAELDGTDHGVVLHRQAENRWEEGYQLYLSEEVAAVADLRAARHYERTEDEKKEENCERCDAEELKIPEDARELLSGNTVAVRLPAALRTALGSVYDSRRLDGAEIALDSVAWDIAPAIRQEPTLNPSTGSGDAVPGTLLHSGELSMTAVDLTVKGRGFDFNFGRTFRNQTVGSGPFGPGWDFSYHQRLRELPDGDVEYYDGRGRRELFEKRDDGTLKAPSGQFVTLDRTAAGWVLIDALHNLARFDRYGRLASLADAAKDSADTGNEMLFAYDPASRLVRVTDTLAHKITFKYDASGRLEKLRDFDDREVRYGYDDAGRLTSVTSPKILTGDSKYPEGLTTRYEYKAATGGLTRALHDRDNLAALIDPRGTRRLAFTYSDSDSDGQAEEVTAETWGTGTIALSYDFGGRHATVTDRRGHSFVYDHDEKGHPTRVQDPAGAVTSFQYNADGLVTSQTAPLQRATTYTYDTGGGRRSQGNLLRIDVAADGRGANGSPGTLSSTYSYEGRSNQLVRTVDSRGSVEEIERDERGLKKSITEAAGTPEASATTFSYDPFGQMVEVTNPNGRKTRYDYFTDGDSRGLLKSETTDPGGLNLTSRYERDKRGNVTGVVSPRGARSDLTLNEVDWVVAATQAAAGAGDGAPALGYTSRFLYDPNGNPVEEHVPFGDGDGTTRETATYGPLDEVLTRTQEVVAGGAVVTVTHTYDANLNLESETDSAGESRHVTYDERNLPVAVVRGSGTPAAVTETLAYDLEGRRTSSADGRGAVWQQHRDGFGRLAEEVDPLGNKTQLTYDAGGNVTGQKKLDAQGTRLAESSAAYDALGRRTIDRAVLWNPGETTGRALETRSEYDRAGNLRKVIDPLGRETVMTYDAADRLRSVIDPAGNIVERTLDAEGNVIVETARERQSDGSVVPVQTTAAFDALGRRTAVTDALGNTWRWLYDARGHVRVEIDPENNVTAHTYDGLGRLVRTVRPEGVEVAYGYDAGSRLTSYRDALGQETRWGYDALGRRTEVTYPDATSAHFTYDGAGNLLQVRDARGTLIDHEYDLAGRLTRRTVTPSAGVEGSLLDTYAYDGLGRLVRAQSGSAVTVRHYDSLSRIVDEATGGRTITYEHDDASNPVQIQYPSGVKIAQAFDPLNRPTTIGRVTGAAAVDPAVTYTYRGTSLLSGKVLGNGLAGSWQYDAARRLIGASQVNAQGLPIVAEALARNPRGLETAQARNDLNGTGSARAYDGAGRLLKSARMPSPLAAAPGNAPADPVALAAAAEAESFSYDRAQNLLSRAITTAGASQIETMPLDASGRNRPASVDGKPLEWDANGNLVRKGGLRFSYDYRNLLVRVATLAGQDVALYTYDAFNRRIAKTVGGETAETVWKEWQPIEEYKGGQLASRRTYGAGLDEAVRIENDLDGDGTPDTSLTPVYDTTGNLVALTGPNGKPIERYDYAPFGEQTVLVDATPPAVEQVRVKGGALWLELSEEVDLSALTQALASGKLTLTDTRHATPVALSVQLPVQEGLQARRRLVATLGSAPAAGTAMHLVLQPAALVDLFLNQPSIALELDFPWPGEDAVLLDQTPPRVEQVVVRDRHLEVELSEEAVLPSATAALSVDGQAQTWTLTADRYTLRSDAALTLGAHQLSIGTGALDLAGLGLAAGFQLNVQVGDSTQIASRRADPRATPASAAGNPFGFHGQPKDPETGLLYVRNRYYDPEMGRFISIDPQGYGDGPNPYAFAGNDPVNKSDPLGLYEEDVHHYLTIFLARNAGFDKQTAADIGFETQELDMDTRDAMFGGGANLENMRKYHFLSFSGLMDMQDKALSGKSLNGPTLRAIGEFIHAWEDSYSHQSGETDRDFAKQYHDLSTIGQDIGHGLHKHKPDWTWDRPELAMKMARTTNHALVLVCKHYLGDSCKPHPFGAVIKKVWDFIVFKPETFTDQFTYNDMAFSVENVRDYTAKIKLLDESYELTPPEREKRAKPYREYLQRVAEAERLRREQAKRNWEKK